MKIAKIWLVYVCPFLSELWHFRLLTLSPLRLEIAVCPIFEPQYIFATKVTQTFVTWEAKQCPNTLHLLFSGFGLLFLQSATPIRKRMKWHFGAILTAAFLETGLEILNYFCCNSYRGAMPLRWAGKITKNFTQFETATTQKSTFCIFWLCKSPDFFTQQRFVTWT